MVSRIVMERNVERVPCVRRCPSRVLRPADQENLAVLLYAAFRGSIDDEGETLGDAERESASLFGDGYGTLLADCSYVMEDAEHLLSACIVTWFGPHDAPLIAFSMTRPEILRQGRARQLLAESIDGLRNRGYDRVTLIVTSGNTPAEALYRAVAFQPVSIGSDTSRGSV